MDSGEHVILGEGRGDTVMVQKYLLLLLKMDFVTHTLKYLQSTSGCN